MTGWNLKSVFGHYRCPFCGIRMSNSGAVEEYHGIPNCRCDRCAYGYVFYGDDDISMIRGQYWDKVPEGVLVVMEGVAYQKPWWKRIVEIVVAKWR